MLRSSSKKKNEKERKKKKKNYSLVSVIISTFNIFPNKQTFHIHLTIIKIKNHKKISFKFKKGKITVNSHVV